jgi:mannose-1-phosphate guanylyltransferase
MMVRCGIVLAAGDGRRLQSFVREWRGDDLPKQYVDFTGARSTLEQTWRRAGFMLPAERLLTIVNRRHLQYDEVRRQLAGRPAGTVIVQPDNKETGPGLLLPLLHLHRRHPDAVVTIFPSDHFIKEEEVFMGHVDLACRVAEQEPAGLVLLGIEPQSPEPDYGYLLPGRRVEDGGGSCVRRVLQFVEKPERASAESLIRGGALWNSFVIAGRLTRLLELFRWMAPKLHAAFDPVRKAIGTAREREATDRVYRRLAPVNFSSHILQRPEVHLVARLLVLPVRGVLWSDWGSASRLITDLRGMGRSTRLPLLYPNNPVVLPSLT